LFKKSGNTGLSSIIKPLDDYEELLMSRTITTDDLRSLIEKKNAITFLDVRRKADYDADREIIPGAEWRDPDKVDEWSAVLPRDKEVVLYCARGGSVSNKVLDRLLAKSFQARYLEGGIAAWITTGNRTDEKRSR
jgi:rhodanese-related sulfurtransferase